MSSGVEHIDDNPEKLEQFVLGALPEPELDAITRHIQGCPRCRDAVYAERRTVAVIRRAGRDAVKERLREELTCADAVVRATIPWPRVLGIAATVIILIGFGIAGRWLALHQSPVNLPTPSPETTAERSTPPPVQPPAHVEDRIVVPSQPKRDAATSTAVTTEDQIARAEPEVPERHLPNAAVNTEALKEDRERGQAKPAVAAEAGGKGEEALRASAMDSQRAMAPRRPIQVTLVVGSPQRSDANKAFGMALKRDATMISDTSAVRVTLYLPEKDSALLHETPVPRWITDDSVSVRLGNRTYGVKVH